MANRKDFEIPITDENDVLQITALGAGNEVGRSCLLDAGIHPAYNGLAALPFYDEIDPAAVDALLINIFVSNGFRNISFHLDHAASLPYFLEKTTFEGRVFMTHPTKAIYKWLLSDYVRVSNVALDEMLYEEQDLLHSYDKIEAVDYHQEVEVEGIKFTSYNAGHVLGAAMFLIEIAGILYTGDYSREEDRHLMAAELPPAQPDVLITESTYGVQNHEPRLEKYKSVNISRFRFLILLQRGGRCLMPVFALGRAQELLLILDEYWEAHPELESVPIYYASSLAKKCMAVYQTYINMMNSKIRKQFAISNPFVFKHISNLKNMDNFDDVGPCVMMASPGMLQSGLSRELFERWCPDKRNGLVITGYCVDGTMARHAMTEPPEVTSLSGAKIPLNMSVDYISFSAHVDYIQNSKFIDEIKAPHVVLVHGESNSMARLKSALQSKYVEREENIKIYSPKNCETVKLYFRGEKLAKAIGRLAAKYPAENQLVSGIIVSKDFQFNIMDPNDLKDFSGISTSAIIQKQTIAYHSSFSLLKYHLEQMYGPLEETLDDDQVPIFIILENIKVRHISKSQVQLEWSSTSMNDNIADSVLAVLLNIESSPASVKITKHSHTTEGSSDNLMEIDEQKMETKKTELSPNTSISSREATENYLRKQFGEISSKDDSKDEIIIKTDDRVAEVNLSTLEVKTDDDILRNRITTILPRVTKLLHSLESCPDNFAKREGNVFEEIDKSKKVLIRNKRTVFEENKVVVLEDSEEKNKAQVIFAADKAPVMVSTQRQSTYNSNIAPITTLLTMIQTTSAPTKVTLLTMTSTMSAPTIAINEKSLKKITI
ncbi:20835_t:CDS:10 [Dentiscutata erythropus]|uniref:Endoribonuclease YSH1 n=1 Tax=Dentiscutata erythropus TaxID=1348616 RepID=A0A9N8YSX7_9GLOM|nr:20835_t:CDS:10 [Dentiscutata erythropus]